MSGIDGRPETAAGDRAGTPGLRLVEGREDGRTDLWLTPDGTFRVTRTAAGRREARQGVLDPAVLARLLPALRTAVPGPDPAPAPARPADRRLTVAGLSAAGDAVWTDGTAHPVPEAAAVLTAAAAQVLAPADPARLPSGVVRGGAPERASEPSPERSRAAIGTVRGRPAYALAEQGRSFGLAALDGTEPLGGSGEDSGVLPTAVALGTAGEREVFAVGGEDGAVQVWDAVSGAALHGTSGGEGAQAVAAGTVQGVPLVFSAGRAGDVRAVRADDGRALGAMSVAARGAAVLRFARCAGLELLAAAGDDAVVRVWDVASGEQLHLLVGHTDRVTALAVLGLGDQAVLASAGEDRRIRLWDLATGAPVAELDGHTATVTGLAFLDLDDRPCSPPALWTEPSAPGTSTPGPPCTAGRPVTVG